jgi:hypothetical protein
MHYWRKGDFKSLRDGAAVARSLGTWPDYADYCIQQEKGLRRQAFEILGRFITKMERTPFAKRKSFVSWLLEFADSLLVTLLWLGGKRQISVV